LLRPVCHPHNLDQSGVQSFFGTSPLSGTYSYVVSLIMPTKLPPPNLRENDILTRANNKIVGIDKNATKCLRQYLDEATHRSPFLQESWLRHVYDHTIVHLDTSQQNPPSGFVPYREFRSRRNCARDIKQAKATLERLLALPVQPLPNLPADVVYEIFKWATVAVLPSLKMCLVSSEIQRCVDPIIFSHCTFFQTRKPCPFFGDKLSPRLQRCSELVQSISLGPLITQAGFEALPRLFPNATSLSFIHLYTNFPPIIYPSIVRFHCYPASFAFLAGEFLIPGHGLPQVTTLSINLSLFVPQELEMWDWAQIRPLDLLSQFWLALQVTHLPGENECLYFLKNRVLANLPRNLELFAVFLDLKNWRSYDDDDDNDWPGWATKDLQSFATGHWHPKTILLLSENNAHYIYQSVGITLREDQPLWEEGNTSKARAALVAREQSSGVFPLSMDQK
ncbi:hypothetical protein DL96DRAFT_1762216, partial [Flagelloscypha sp. PMI_526]